MKTLAEFLHLSLCKYSWMFEKIIQVTHCRLQKRVTLREEKIAKEKNAKLKNPNISQICIL